MDNSIFNCVSHINVRVEDTQRSVDFYRNILGFEYMYSLDLSPVSPTVSTYMKKGGVIVELAQGHKMEDYSTAGMINHFALDVENIEDAYKYLKDNDIPIISEIEKVKDYFYCFFAAGPSGERFEIIQFI